MNFALKFCLKIIRLNVQHIIQVYALRKFLPKIEKINKFTLHFYFTECMLNIWLFYFTCRY